MSAQSEWLKDLAEAANELGYLVDQVYGRNIRLVRRSGGTVDIQIESTFLSGALLRETLKPVGKAVE